MFSFKKNKVRTIYEEIYNKFSTYTMVPAHAYISNLKLCEKYREIKGSIVECGVWRGGMTAGIASLMQQQHKMFFLCDSFEGLPDAKEIDGTSAIEWQRDKDSPMYFDNCRAEESFTVEAMTLANVKNYRIVKGWFNETLGDLKFPEGISILRLDGDWYDSTMSCLNELYPAVNKGGIIVIDDYYTWDGCCQAVHDYLSKNKLNDRIREYENGIAYIVKDVPNVYQQYISKIKS